MMMMMKPFSLSSLLLIVTLLFGESSATKEPHLRGKEAFLDELERTHRSGGDYTYWLGGISEDLRILFRCTPSFDEVVVYSLDQGGALIPASDTQFTAETNKIEATFNRIDAKYQAKIVEDDESGGKAMFGWWHQVGTKMLLNVELVEPSAKHPVPRELAFLVDKAVTADPDQLGAMEGYWSGEFVADEGESERVIVQVHKLGEGVYEPLVFLPDEDEEEGSLPMGLRNFVVNKSDGYVKIVLDNGPDNNTIFEGILEDGTKLKGMVRFDDEDAEYPLTLEWSKDKPTATMRLD